ncbi:MAG: hypothetical protein M1832_003423 [Thelocarpon impressellum]|nr:MAG: hypothetical protein M1832_003423 [Thelocarpon impressellum]
MLCAISGEAPQVPVASRKSGHVFEKRLIEAYIAENGKDPVTGEELAVEDLVDLRSARVVRPRPPTLTSIPSLLSVFQNEWDALALQTYTLRQQLAQTRQELSTALYQHDAAVRVIARLTRERDEARDALSKVTVNAGGAVSNGDHMQIDGEGLPEAVAAKVDATQERLSKTRRKRVVPDEWATAELIETYKPTQSSEPLYPGGKAIALDVTGDLALVGGVDGVAGVYSVMEDKLVQSLKGGGGAITDALWWGDRAVIATASGAVKIFEGGSEFASFGSHAGSVEALAMHPSGEMLASVGVDKSYVFYDLANLKPITQIITDSALTTAAFHPDGHLFAAGSAAGQIKVFEVKSGTNAANFACPARVKAFAFSENGTWLAAVSDGQTSVTIWDLRKAAEIKSLEVGGAIDSIKWDYTGQFLAAAGASGIAVQAYSKASKQWAEALRSAVPAVAVEWGAQAQSLVAVDGRGVVTTLGAA